MTIEPTKYRYSMDLKLSHVYGHTAVSSVFKHAEDLIVASKTFDAFDIAVNSLNQFTTEMVVNINVGLMEDRYGIISEVNPARTGQETISKEWSANEIAKVWIVDKILQAEQPTPIKAIGLAQILEVPSDPVILN